MRDPILHGQAAPARARAPTSSAPHHARLVIGHTWHRRHGPAEHRFTYPLFALLVDLDELPALDAASALFGHNRHRLFALHESDYGRPGPGSLKQRILAILRQAGLQGPVGRVELLTMPRVLGYAFNPVNFYWIYRPDGSPAAHLAEVNNTFGERHFYPLLDPCPARLDDQAYTRYLADKRFHVSPFYDRSGQYDFHITPTRGERIAVHVDKAGPDGIHFESGFGGRVRPAGTGPFARLFLGSPLMAAKTLPRILWQAAKLHYARKLPVHPKPIPDDPHTLPKPPGRLQRMAMRAVLAILARIRDGRLTLTLPDGSQRDFGQPDAAPVQLQVHDYRFFTRVVKAADIGFGEAWTAGEFETDDLTRLLELFVRNEAYLRDPRRLRSTWLARKLDAVRHALRRNTVKQAEANIHAHYDLGNAFYQRLLDPSMLYSCAIYDRPDSDLASAQDRKIQTLIDKARISPEHHLLEIGCGWGGFAIEAARRSGCRVTGITISKAQHACATRRVQEAGLADQVEIRLCDYRHIEGQFDRIVSIEMLEAVGHAYFDDYFAAIERALKPDGLVVLQVITIPEQRYEQYRRGCDWIQKYIFPGGLLPSITALGSAIGRSSHLVIEHLENIGPHYARTLAHWRDNFTAHWDEIQALGFDERFRRTWLYYLAYCEAGFANRHISDLHLVLTRPRNLSLDIPAALPGTPSPS